MQRHGNTGQLTSQNARPACVATERAHDPATTSCSDHTTTSASFDRLGPDHQGTLALGSVFRLDEQRSVAVVHRIFIIRQDVSHRCRGMFGRSSQSRYR